VEAVRGQPVPDPRAVGVRLGHDVVDVVQAAGDGLLLQALPASLATTRWRRALICAGKACSCRNEHVIRAHIYAPQHPHLRSSDLAGDHHMISYYFVYQACSRLGTADKLPVTRSMTTTTRRLSGCP
jgi:hypothetical protein